MTTTIEAIYENGVLRPVKPLEGVPEHSVVRLTINESSRPHPLANCIGIMPDEDANEIRRIIDEEFSKVNPDDWK